jgi:hypothetical protein
LFGLMKKMAAWVVLEKPGVASTELINVGTDL